MGSNFNEKQLDVLMELGLNRIQAGMYLTSLKHGMLSALELSRLMKVSRQRIYEEAEELVEMGIYEITRKQRRKYIPISPGKLLKIGKKKIIRTEEVLANVSEMVPQLELLSIPQKDRVVVKYYEGLLKIRDAYEDELDASENTEILSLAGSIDDIFKFFPESYWDKWNRKFVKYNSRSRMLVHNSDVARKTAAHDKEYKRETKWLHNFPLKVNIDVFNNAVLIVSFYDEIAIWIESQVLAQSYRTIFEVLWGLAQPFK